MVPFGGWEMPLSYPSGTVAEHLACRTDAVVFDVSHLGTVRVEGQDAKSALQAAFTNDLDKISVGRTQYTHLLGDDASVLDDLIVWWIDTDVFDVMPNASNTDDVVQAISGRETTDERAVLAIQGPRARELLSTVSTQASMVAHNCVERVEILGANCVVAGTGYTGEDGVEIAVPLSSATMVFESLINAGISPAGLGARDTLRLEAGFPLHGHELGAGISPIEAGLSWVVAWNKNTFRGRDALKLLAESGPRKVLIGIATDGRRPPREGCAVSVDGRAVGMTTSGNFSPTLNHGIALAFVEPKSVQLGSNIVVSVRGSDLPGRVVKTPFIAKRNY